MKKLKVPGPSSTGVLFGRAQPTKKCKGCKVDYTSLDGECPWCAWEATKKRGEGGKVVE